MGNARALLRGHPARAAGRVTRDEPGHAPGPMAFPPGADRRAIEGNVASGAVEAVQRRVLEHGLPSATHRARPLWRSGWSVAGSSAPSLVGITPQASQVVGPFERRYFLIHASIPRWWCYATYASLNTNSPTDETTSSTPFAHTGPLRCTSSDRTAR